MNLTAGNLEQAFDMELPLLCVMHSKGGFAFECRWAIESFQSFVVVVGVVDLLGHVGVDSAVERCHHVADDIWSHTLGLWAVGFFLGAELTRYLTGGLAKYIISKTLRTRGSSSQGRVCRRSI